MSLIIAVGVPYHVKIASTGIPLHEAKVEFCIPKQDVSFNFPAKAITDDEYVFTVTDAVSEYMNTTLDYKLYVYYKNARFEADTGSFNLIDKEAFDVEMKKPEKKLAETIREKAKKRPGDKKVITESDDKKPEVTSTPTETKEPKETKVQATKPTPTPTVETTTTLKEAKDAIKKAGSKTGLSKILVTETTVEETPDANTKVKEILSSINKTVTPSTELATTPSAEGAKSGGNFLDEVEKMRKAQAKIQKDREEKEKSQEKTQRVKKAIKDAEEKAKKKK